MSLPRRPSRISAAWGQTRNASRFGQGMCQNWADHDVGPLLPDHPRQEREVVVLDEDEPGLVLELLEHGLGEPGVDPLIVLPVGFAEDRPDVDDVAQRPEALVGIAVVEPLFLHLAEPDPPEDVAGVVRRDRDVVPVIDDVAVRIPQAGRDPGPAAGPDDRIEGHGHAAGRGDAADPLVGVDVDVGFAVRDDDQLPVADLLGDRALQGFAVPGHG